MNEALLTQQRCFHHGTREAVARCPQCRRYFCRECVTEHDDRLICAACLAKRSAARGSGAARWRAVATGGECLVAVLTAWLFFYGLGRALLLLPDAFHSGTLWQVENNRDAAAPQNGAPNR